MLKTVVLLLAVFFSSSHQQCFSKNDAVPAPTLKMYNAWVASAQSFSLTLLKSLSGNPNITTVLFSPSSVREALLLAYFGAVNETEDSIAKVLQIPPGQKKPLTWKIWKSEKIMNLRRTLRKYPLKSATKIFISNKLRLRQCIEDKLENELEIINANAETEWTQNHINNWVERETDGKIKDFLKYLNSYTLSTLVNAVSFKAKWISGFNPNNTQVIRFTKLDGYPTRATYMVKDDKFESGYSQELEARLLMLPHEANRTGMIIVLPDKKLDTLINKLNDKTFGFVINRQNYKPSYFRAFVPKIGKRSNVHLDTAFEKLGIGNALTVNADFSGFTGKKDVFITEVVHEAVIEVDEDGSNIKGSSGIAIERSALGLGEPFICDRPFLYIMYDFLARKVLLIGTFLDSN